MDWKTRYLQRVFCFAPVCQGQGVIWDRKLNGSNRPSISHSLQFEGKTLSLVCHGGFDEDSDGIESISGTRQEHREFDEHAWAPGAGRAVGNCSEQVQSQFRAVAVARHNPGSGSARACAEPSGIPNNSETPSPPLNLRRIPAYSEPIFLSDHSRNLHPA